MSRTARIVLIVMLPAVMAVAADVKSDGPDPVAAEPDTSAATPSAKLPMLLDLGSKKCIPCKKMAPILADLKKQYAGKFDVEFIDVWLQENAGAAKAYGIRMIPTQIFLDARGKELRRHEGFLGKDDILSTWKELGYDFPVPAANFERWTPARADTRSKRQICHMCDGDISAKTLVAVMTEEGEVRLCSPHHYFVMVSCLTADTAGLEKRASMTDWATGKSLPAAEAVYLCGLDEKTGRPWIRAFADRDAALGDRRVSGGGILRWEVLQRKELATRCGFCDRAVYPEDAAVVKAGGIHTWGCCSHCALGVAVRTGKDIEVRVRDRLAGTTIVVRTRDGGVESVEPETAVAWFGMRKKANGSWGSAGCFNQGLFASAENLTKWVEQNPHATGKLITVQQALADKMKLTPQQISNACKLGRCAPK